MSQEQMKSDDPELYCENHGRLNREDEPEPPFYKVPFWWGPEPRLTLEWWCEECVEGATEEGYSDWIKIEDDVVLTDIRGNGKFWRPDEAEEAYLHGALFG